MTQGELFQAETTWFHIFKTMIDSGDLAKMGPHAFTVYCVIKAHTNFSTGRAFPAIETIVDKSGISIAQVKRELVHLEAMEYIKKTRSGRNNIYTLREKIGIKDQQGIPTAIASWDYLPSALQAAMADLKNVLMTGELAGAKVVHIEKLQVQVNINHVQDQGIVINAQDFEKLPQEMKDNLLSLKEKLKK